jgi:hypothetical protein
MTYETLKEFFQMFHLEQISKMELTMAIELWQEAGARSK